MKKLFISAMAGVIAFGSVNALAASMLVDFSGVEVANGETLTREEMLKVLNEAQIAEMQRKYEEEKALAEALAKQQAAELAGEQTEAVVEEQPVEVVVEEPVKEDFKVDMSKKAKGGSVLEKYGTTSFKAILEIER